jgi:hypothetical protein
VHEAAATPGIDQQGARAGSDGIQFQTTAANVSASVNSGGSAFALIGFVATSTNEAATKQRRQATRIKRVNG